MNRSQSKYFNTALLMDEALIDLLAVKGLEYITVKEICEKAGVNRSTFYLHYETIADLLNEALEMVQRRFLEQFPQDPQEFIPGIETAKLEDLMLIDEAYMRPYLCFIRDNKNVYRAAFKNPASMNTDHLMDSSTKNVLMPILKRFAVPEPERAYWVSFYIQGTRAIVREWLNRDCSDSVEDVMRIMAECIRPGSDVKKYEKKI